MPPRRALAALLLATSLAAAPGARAARPLPIADPPPPLPPIGNPEAAPIVAPPPSPLPAVPSQEPQPPSVQTAQVTLEGMMDREVVGLDGAAIGHVIDVLVDRQGAPQAVLVETGGFLGVGERKVAVAWSSLSFEAKDAAHPLVVDMTADQVRGAPAFAGGGQRGPVAIGPLPSPLPPPPPERAPAPAPLAGNEDEGDTVAPYPAPLPAPRVSSRR